MTTAAHLATTEPTGRAKLKQRIRTLGGGRAVRNRHHAAGFLAANPGPLMMLRGLLESNCAGADLREQLEAIYDRHERAEYLVVLGRKEQDNGIL